MTMTSIPRELVDELGEAARRLESRTAAHPAATPGDIESPFALREGGIRGNLSDIVGACSLQQFATAGSLYATHADAQGFLAGLPAANFWMKDGNVQPWAYYEQYDNWQDDYGMDAVLVAYHSGHGGMAGDGNFLVPLGASWGGSSDAWSHSMRLGNERARYLFWSTCVSLRVLDGHSPYRTWAPANLGVRMLFGYESVSFDNPNYGSAFWRHWRAGKSFSTAWLDASWYDISHNQAPSAAACGATSAEASDRLYNERYFQWAGVSHNAWQWRWYYAAGGALAARAPSFALPSALMTARLDRPTVNPRFVDDVLGRHGVAGSAAVREYPKSAGGPLFLAREGDLRAAFMPDGGYDIDVAAPNREIREPLPTRDAIGLAGEVIRRHGLDTADLTFDRVLHKCEGGVTVDGDGTVDEPRVVETVVQFTQVVNGLPVLLPGPGGVSVSVDNAGTVTSIRNTARPVVALSERAQTTVQGPPDPSGNGGAARSMASMTPDRALADAWQDRMKAWVVQGRMPRGFTEIPGSAEIGYKIAGDRAVLVARKDVEVDFGDGLAKRYSVEVPIAE